MPLRFAHFIRKLKSARTKGDKSRCVLVGAGLVPAQKEKILIFLICSIEHKLKGCSGRFYVCPKNTYIERSICLNKKIKISLIILLIAFAIIFFMQKVYKTKKTGNNINKSTSDLLEYILNISSYEATAKVTINSNKTSNEYVIKQYYLKPIYSKQIIKEPQSIENLEILHNGKDLSIKNTNLGLSKIYQNYNYINENILWLNYFLDNCNENGYQIEENNEEIIIKNEVKKDKLKGNLYINKKDTYF